MTSFLTSLSEVVTSVMTMFGNVASSLMSNTIFMLIIGVIFVGILFGLVLKFIISFKNDHYISYSFDSSYISCTFHGKNYEFTIDEFRKILAETGDKKAYKYSNNKIKRMNHNKILSRASRGFI